MPRDQRDPGPPLTTSISKMLHIYINKHMYDEKCPLDVAFLHIDRQTFRDDLDCCAYNISIHNMKYLNLPDPNPV